MTEKLFHLEKDCATGVETLREYSPEEYAQRDMDIAAAQEAEIARQAAEAEAAAKKAAVLEALATAAGLTVDEVTAALA